MCCVRTILKIIFIQILVEKPFTQEWINTKYITIMYINSAITKWYDSMLQRTSSQPRKNTNHGISLNLLCMIRFNRMEKILTNIYYFKFWLDFKKWEMTQKNSAKIYTLNFKNSFCTVMCGEQFRQTGEKDEDYKYDISN